MADAVGSRNIWDSLDRLQSNGGESPKSDESRLRHTVIHANGPQGQNPPENRCAQRPQIGSSDSGSALKPRKVKPREPMSLLATMQKKLKINPLNLQQKVSGSVGLHMAAEPERPLDLCTRSDDSASVMTEIPLDLSLKRESETSLSSYLSVQPYSTSGFKTDETLCITNRANQCGGSVSISKSFPVLPCTHKKVSPVRPIIGGKPVVTDSNGNIPHATVVTDAGSKRNVFSVISIPTTQDIFVLNSSSDTGSKVVQQRSLLKSGFKEICAHTSDTPVRGLSTGENFAYSDSVASVIDYNRSNDFLCPSVTASCNSISNSMSVPDLVRSTLGQHVQNSVDACSNLPRETCLTIPTYKFQKKPRTFSKKALRASGNGDAEKRKSVPLAEVRPSCLLPLTSTTMAAESLVNSKTVPIVVESNNVLSSSFADEQPIVIVSNANSAERSLDSSISPPKLCIFSPLNNKSSGDCSNACDSVLLSPPMPILSPHALPKTSYPASISSGLHRMDNSHPIYSISSCVGSSAVTASTTDSRSAAQFLESTTCGASSLSEPGKIAPHVQSGATTFTTMVDSVASSSRTPTMTTNVDKEDLLETGISAKDSCAEISRHHIENDIHDDTYCALNSTSPNSKPAKRNVLESKAVNAFMVNSGFAREVYKKSKLHFHAALAVDFDAFASENRRPSKDMIQRTKYYKLIAQKLGFSVSTSSYPPELVLQHKSPLKSTCEIDPLSREQRSAKNNKLWTPEHGHSAKDTGQTKAESLNKSSGKRSKSSQLDVKFGVNDECSSVAGTSRGRVEAVTAQKVTRSSKRKLGGFIEDEFTVQHDSTAHIVDNNKSELSPKRRKILEGTAISTSASSSDALVTRSMSKVDSNKNSLNTKTERSPPIVNTDTCSGKVETRQTAKQKSLLSLSKKEKLHNCEELLTDISSNKETKEVNSIKSELTDVENSADALLQTRPSPSNKRTRKRFNADLTPESVSDQREKDNSPDDLHSRSKHVFTRERKSKEPKVTVEKRICVSPDVFDDDETNSKTLPKTEKKHEIKVEDVQDKMEENMEIKSEIDYDESQSLNEGNDELSEESSKKKLRHASAGRFNRSLLRELANSDGYVAEKRTPSRSDNLFIDSRYLTREERSLQMQLMRITKLEVKEEWSKVKERKESTKMKNCSQKKPEHKAPAKGNTKLCETTNEEQPENNTQPKEKKKLAQKSKLKSSIVLPKEKVALKQKNKMKKKIIRPITAGKYSTCKSVHKQPKFDRSSWISHHRMKKTAKKCHGRFRCRWQSGIWKKKPKPSLKPKLHSERMESPAVQEKIHQGLTVDVNVPTSRMSLSPCSFVSSKLSPCSIVERTNTRDDDVVSMSSSVTESSFPRRTIPSEVKKMVSSHATGETVLHRAARLGYPDVALWCCEARYVGVNTKDYAGYTPLHETVLHSNVAIARYLIHYGADLNSAAERRGGTRPLHEAVDCNSTEMVRLLLSAGADINLTSYSGKTVHDVAHNSSMKEFLKAYVADLTGGDTETEWHFRPSWDVSSDDESIELGMDLLALAPDDTELDDQMVAFECSEKPFVPAYVLRVHKEAMPRNYVLLCDVLNRLQTTRKQLILDYPDVVLEKIAKDYLFSQLVTMDFISQHKRDEIKMTCDDDHQYVDVLLMTSQLQGLLNIDVISINCGKSGQIV